jgi:hypothetical protein
VVSALETVPCRVRRAPVRLRILQTCDPEAWKGNDEFQWIRSMSVRSCGWAKTSSGRPTTVFLKVRHSGLCKRPLLSGPYPSGACPRSAVPGACNFRDQQGRRWDLSGSNDAPGDHKDWEWRRMSAHFESAISRLRPTSERRARTTAVATLAAAQNGTSGVTAAVRHPE